jgi:hypothetical protein
MPKKTNALHKFHIHSPEEPMETAFKNYLTDYWQMKSWNEMTLWLVKHQQYAQPDAWQRTSSRSNGTNELTSAGKLFLSCPMFFDRYSPLRAPFSVLREYIFNNASPRIEIVTNESRITEIQRALDQISPFKWPHKISLSDYRYCDCYLFGNHLWTLTRDEEVATEEELCLIFLNAVDTERQRFEHLKRKFAGLSGEGARSPREPIPEHVRVFVWRRDQGRCVQCGSNERLEYDHIIPVSKGGSNTERNIQLLCESCNRKKSNMI